MLFQIEVSIGFTENKTEGPVMIQFAIKSLGKAILGTACARQIIGEEKLGIAVVAVGTVVGAWLTLQIVIAAVVTAEVVLGLAAMTMVQMRIVQPTSVLSITKNCGWKVMKVSGRMRHAKCRAHSS